jgi:hypothetical protein
MHASTDRLLRHLHRAEGRSDASGNHRSPAALRVAIFGLHLLACTMVCASVIGAFVLQQPEEASFPTFTNRM